MEYRVRWVPFQRGNSRNERPVVLQSVNGACPLLALVNILLLRGNEHVV
jgi:hypothetical protein